MSNNDPGKLSHNKRRQLLKGVALGGGAFTVSQWNRPVVQSVVLPAHANGSPREPTVFVRGFDTDVAQDILVTFPDS